MISEYPLLPCLFAPMLFDLIFYLEFLELSKAFPSSYRFYTAHFLTFIRSLLKYHPLSNTSPNQPVLSAFQLILLIPKAAKPVRLSCLFFSITCFVWKYLASCLSISHPSNVNSIGQRLVCLIHSYNPNNQNR